MAINGVALVLFFVAGSVAWLPGLLMAGAAIATGYLGAAYTRLADPSAVRKWVLVIAWCMTAFFFWKYYVYSPVT
jgi:uncharacterized membrane protein YfcA